MFYLLKNEKKKSKITSYFFSEIQRHKQQNK